MQALYTCSHCDSQYAKWQGQCDECQKWGTIQESGQEAGQKPAELKSVSKPSSSSRISVGMNEFENVLGGGLVRGSIVLLAGDPGIGKSTLVLQIVHGFQSKTNQPLAGNSKQVLYICGEESAEQIGLRMDRLKVSGDNIRFAGVVDIKSIINTIQKHKPDLVIIDSIQTIADSSIASEPGSITQIRATTAQLMQIAKSTNIPIIIIGHVTKEGSVAGPQVLAHMVDVVLYLEGDKLHQYRLLRSTKNRFGPTNQVGVFSMQDSGLIEVKNPSQLFLEGGGAQNSGSVVSVIMEGLRPFLIEIQALTNKTSYGYPKRATSGFDLSRLELLIAVLQRRGGLKLDNQDVFLNIVGGLRVKDPALDLAACLSIASSLSNQAMPKKSVVIGELGLAGEIRPVSHVDLRVKEAERLGFKELKNIKNIEHALKVLNIGK